MEEVLFFKGTYYYFSEPEKREVFAVL